MRVKAETNNLIIVANQRLQALARRNIPNFGSFVKRARCNPIPTFIFSSEKTYLSKKKTNNKFGKNYPYGLLKAKQ
jgi:hypothetical protein